MKDYEPSKFIDALHKRISGKPIKCSYCGGRKLTSLSKRSS